MPRSKRVRADTLLPGSSLYDAFFGQDGNFRVALDQNEVTRMHNSAENFQLPRRRLQSTFKSKRKMLPRYEL